MASAYDSQFDDDDASQLMDDGSQPSDLEQDNRDDEQEEGGDQDKSKEQEESPTSVFEGSVAVRQSIFDRRMSIWRDPYTLSHEVSRLGKEEMSASDFEVSPDCSKIVVHDKNSHNIFLFNTATLERTASYKIKDKYNCGSLSFSSDGKRILALLSSEDNSVYVHVIEIQIEGPTTTLLKVKKLNVKQCSHVKCKFMPGDNSKILIRNRFGENNLLFLYDLPTDNRIWKIKNVFDFMFEFTKDASKILLSTYTTLPDSKEIERKDLILVDALTGELISRIIYPAEKRIDCAVFSDDETRLVISMDEGLSMQIMSLPNFVVMGMSKYDMSGKFQTYGAFVNRMILSPGADLVLRVEDSRLSIFDLRTRRMVQNTPGIQSSLFSKGIRVSSDESMILFNQHADVRLMHVKSFAERLLMRILVMCIAQGRRRIRLPFIPSEVWHMIAERFLGIEAANFLH